MYCKVASVNIILSAVSQISVKYTMAESFNSLSRHRNVKLYIVLINFELEVYRPFIFSFPITVQAKQYTAYYYRFYCANRQHYKFHAK